jgi:hypothetical protein
MFACLGSVEAFLVVTLFAFKQLNLNQGFNVFPDLPLAVFPVNKKSFGPKKGKGNFRLWLRIFL